MVFVLLLIGLPSMLLFKYTSKYATKKKEQVGYFLFYYPVMVWICFLFIFVNELVFYVIFIPLGLLSVAKGTIPYIERQTWKYFVILLFVTLLLASHNFYNRVEDEKGLKYTGLTTAYVDDWYFSSLINRFVLTHNYDSPNYWDFRNNYYTALLFNYFAGFFTIFGHVPLHVVAQLLSVLIYFSCLIALFYFFRLLFTRRGALLGVIITLSTVFSLSFTGYAAPWEIANISGAITPFSYELTLFKPQALALVFLVLAGFFFVKIVREPEKWFNYAAFGFVFGTIVNTHAMTMLLSGIFFFVSFLMIFLKEHNKVIFRNYLLLIAVSLIVGARYLYISLFKIKGVSIYPELFWYFNYIKWDIGKFLFTFGHVLPLMILGILSLFYTIKRTEGIGVELQRRGKPIDRTLKILLFVLLLSFIVPNVLTYGSWHFDRSLTYAQFIYALFAVIGLKFLVDFDKTSRYAFIVLLIIVGFVYMHNAFVFNQTLIPKYYNDKPVFVYYYQPELEAVDWIKGNTEKNAVFVNNGWHLWRRAHPVVVFSGRKTIKGFEHDDVGNMVSKNYKDEVERTLAVIRIYNQTIHTKQFLKMWGYENVNDVIDGKKKSIGNNLTLKDIGDVLTANVSSLLEKYNVSYIYYGIEERQMYGNGDDIFSDADKYEHVYDTQYVDIWKVV
jgi:hypothetical protein